MRDVTSMWDALQANLEVAEAAVSGRPADPAAVSIFVVAASRLCRLDPADVTDEQSRLLEDADRMLREHGQALGRGAAGSLQELPNIERGEIEPGLDEDALMDTLLAAEAQALVLGLLPSDASRTVQERLDRLEEMLALEPELFEAVSDAALARIEEMALTPFDPAWRIWLLAARAREAAALPVPEAARDLRDTLDRAWNKAEDQEDTGEVFSLRRYLRDALQSLAPARQEPGLVIGAVGLLSSPFFREAFPLAAAGREARVLFRNEQVTLSITSDHLQVDYEHPSRPAEGRVPELEPEGEQAIVAEPGQDFGRFLFQLDSGGLESSRGVLRIPVLGADDLLIHLPLVEEP